MNNTYDGLQEIIDKALDEMALESKGNFNPEHCNLAEFCRKTGLTRQKARTIKANGFKVKPHGRLGCRRSSTKLSGYTSLVDDLLKKGVTNSQVIFSRLKERGYQGGLTTIKTYTAAHKDLVAAKRKTVAPKASRGQRFKTEPGESYQMDWGFVNVVDWKGIGSRIACFVMVCHYCATAYVEFFPNARQENLFIGMLHAFMYMGVPKEVLTDNMKSVVNARDIQGYPIWNADYAAFMRCVGFQTRLCKPRHPYTKGKVERLVRYVKDNFLAGREYTDITDLNADVLRWCKQQSSKYRRPVDCVPAEVHRTACSPYTRSIENPDGLELYLCPRRKISFDGFVNYEGRRFGVPYWYDKSVCRISREDKFLHIYDEDLSKEIVCHDVTWSRKDSWCEGQWADIEQPEELPSQQVSTTVLKAEPSELDAAFAKFDFKRSVM